MRARVNPGQYDARHVGVGVLEQFKRVLFATVLSPPPKPIRRRVSSKRLKRP